MEGMHHCAPSHASHSWFVARYFNMDETWGIEKCAGSVWFCRIKLSDLVCLCWWESRSAFWSHGNMLLVRIPKSSRLEVSLLTHHSLFSIICAGKHISATTATMKTMETQDFQRILWLSEANGEWSERSEHCPRSTSQIFDLSNNSWRSRLNISGNFASQDPENSFSIWLCCKQQVMSTGLFWVNVQKSTMLGMIRYAVVITARSAGGTSGWGMTSLSKTWKRRLEKFTDLLSLLSLQWAIQYYSISFNIFQLFQFWVLTSSFLVYVLRGFWQSFCQSFEFFGPFLSGLFYFWHGYLVAGSSCCAFQET